eukprot:scaffold139982_cov16-Tisochrysis_lutea.AAC.1
MPIESTGKPALSRLFHAKGTPLLRQLFQEFKDDVARKGSKLQNLEYRANSGQVQSNSRQILANLFEFTYQLYIACMRPWVPAIQDYASQVQLHALKEGSLTCNLAIGPHQRQEH